MSMFTTAPTTVSTNVPHHPEYECIFITPSDSVDLPSGSGNGRISRAIQVTGAGNVAVNLIGGGTATLTGLTAGQRVVVAATRVLATGTTATGIAALY